MINYLNMIEMLARVVRDTKIDSIREKATWHLKRLVNEL